MPNRGKSIPSTGPAEDWASGIPLGSLDQLQHALEDGSRYAADEAGPSDAVCTSLPASQPGSLYYSRAHSRSTTPSRQSVSIATGNTTASATPRPNVHNNASAEAQEQYSASISTMYTASAGSLSGIHNAGAAAEVADVSDVGSMAHIPLTNPRPSEAGQLQNPDTALEPPATSDQEAATFLEGTLGPPRRRRRPAASRRVPSYWQKIEPLVQCLPHLKAIDPEHRRHEDVGTVSCMDYMRSLDFFGIKDVWAADQPQNSDELFRRIRELKTISDPNIATRVILVEDLSRD